MVDWITSIVAVIDRKVRLIPFAGADKNTVEQDQCRHSICPMGVHNETCKVALSAKQARLREVLGRWDIHLLAHRTHLD